MLPLRTAARMLADAASLEALAPIAALLGFPGAPLALDGALGEAAGLAPGDGRAAVVSGPGALRALLVETADGRPARAAVERLARRLAARAPHPLWLVVATAPATGALVLAVWDAADSPPRVHALTVDRRNVVDSDAVTLRALHAATPVAATAPATDGFADGFADATTHAAWLDLLGRDALTRRFYRELAQVVSTLAGELRTPARVGVADRRTFALLQLSRLLFLSFVEAKGWLDGDPAFLARTFERCMASGGGYHRRVLRPMVFGTLNTPIRQRAAAARAFGRVPFLNGGLFARTALERRLGDARWDDAAIGLIFERLLGRYRFTAREDQPRWTDAAVDPEMLGRAFESLMNAGARRDSGAFYTPPALVARATRGALASALAAASGPAGATLPASVVESALDGAIPDPADGARLLRAVHDLRLLDPACGSGAFLVHALESMAALGRRAGDHRAITTVRRELLATTIFGVDVNPMAVWLCELRLWLSVLIESDEPDPLRVPPLPNLDHHVRVGDALGGGGLDVATRMTTAGAAALTRLRGRYVRASGVSKRTLGRALDRQERAVALAALDAAAASVSARRLDLLAAVRARDLFGDRDPPSAVHTRQLDALRAELRRLRARRRALAGGAGLPFAFATHFADIAAVGGFGLVLGNPPWVRPHRLTPAERRRLRQLFVVAREAPWQAGAELAGAGAGFAAQADLSALFVERALTLLRPGGTVGLLLPAKLWRALAGGGVRRLLAADTRLTAVEDWSRSPHSFDAAVYPSLLVAVRREPARPSSPRASPSSASSSSSSASSPLAVARIADWSRGGERSWCTPTATLPLGGEPGAPWLLLPPDARRAFDRLRERGTRLASGPAGRPLLGVKSGCNEAYVFRRGTAGEAVPAMDGATAATRALAAAVEDSLLRPLARGEAMRPWRLEAARELLLWPHDDAGAPLADLPPGAMRWLESWKHRLERRTDAGRTRRWWSLFRTDAAAHDLPRVVWADLGIAPRASMLPAGDMTIPLNSCYALRCARELDALAITAILNSPPMIAWLAALAEPARGGYHRHLAWTVALLPLPSRWVRARDALAPLARRARAGDVVSDDELTSVVCWSHGLRPTEVAPLLAWAAR
ncbi:MAG: Eco57I restriction-modification methylase domain-containing protein [Gemmatimonadaceae bacterium]